MDERVSFRAAYERFPMSIKGAFVLRGADGMPHQVRVEAARAAECAGRRAHAIPIEPAILEIAPTMDTFVPFEVPTTELLAGWYQLECDVVVDADPEIVRAGSRFAIPWPRAAVRRGTVAIAQKAGAVSLDALECTGDVIRILYTSTHALHTKLSVDGEQHPILEVEHDDDAGRGRVLAYPVLRSHQRLSIEVRGEKPVAVALP